MSLVAVTPIKKESYFHHIKRFNPTRHLEGLATLIERAFGEELARTQSSMVRDMRQMAHWGSMLQMVHAINPILRGYVWIEENRVVGNVSLSSESDAVWRLSNVAVLPDFRGRGIAGHLVDRGIEHAKHHNVRYLILEVKPDNAVALNLYRHRGFEAFETLDEMYLSRASWPVFLEPFEEDVRPVQASDAHELYRLMLSSVSPERQRFFPVHAREFRRGFWQRLLQYVRLAFKDELLYELVGEHEQNIVAYGRAIAHLFHGPHELKIHVRPDQRGEWERKLARGLLWGLHALPRSRVRARIPAHHREAVEALEILGFESVRILKQMFLDLDQVY
ncbi:MAG: GNAT family N-acetyltransferase [Anaerolineales bacterium]